MVLARKRTAATASEAEAGEVTGLMQGSQVLGQPLVGEARQVPALLPQKGLQAVKRRLVGPAGVWADAGAGPARRRRG